MDYDPYHRWLGIPGTEQPADHYRLLGIARFEANEAVIRHAVERQSEHVRRYQLGKYAEDSQRILNEIAKAKACLLNPQRKKQYDQHLRQASGASPAMPVAGLGGSRIFSPSVAWSSWALLAAACGIVFVVTAISAATLFNIDESQAVVEALEAPASPAKAQEGLSAETERPRLAPIAACEVRVGLTARASCRLQNSPTVVGDVRYSLGGDAPKGATIDPATGSITILTDNLAPGAYVISVRAEQTAGQELGDSTELSLIVKSSAPIDEP